MILFFFKSLANLTFNVLLNFSYCKTYFLTKTHLSRLSDLLPSKSYGGEAGLPCRSIHEQVCREGGDNRAPVIGEDLHKSLALIGGPKPCSDVGPLTVIVI
jgi:hypothetical protein